ncbi:hypothetical protein BDZ97DRAFT_1201276 [Flammula alnicola]|nr:hypothetical protein BDZ97DRAFT_1201276 [Flammula alnicola]
MSTEVWCCKKVCKRPQSLCQGYRNPNRRTMDIVHLYIVSILNRACIIEVINLRGPEQRNHSSRPLNHCVACRCTARHHRVKIDLARKWSQWYPLLKTIQINRQMIRKTSAQFEASQLTVQPHSPSHKPHDERSVPKALEWKYPTSQRLL